MPDTNPCVAVEVLAAGHGDCLLVEVARDRRPWRLLVDGGTVGTFPRLAERLQRWPPGERHIDLAVITHIDADHIGGAIRFFERRAELGVTIGDVWFNGYQHLPVARGGVQGDRLSALLAAQFTTWNRAFAGRAIATDAPGRYAVVAVAEGIEIVLLSPPVEQLARLRAIWDHDVRDSERGTSNTDTDGIPGVHRGRQPPVIAPDVDLNELALRRTVEDEAEANGSSIAFLLRAQCGGVVRSLLLSADAHPSLLGAALWQLAQDTHASAVHADVFKLPHHGSQANVTADLLGIVSAGHYVVSTNGALFHHPDPVALARVAVAGTPDAAIWFNYDKAETGWFRRHDDLANRRIVVPGAGTNGVRLFSLF